MQGNCRQLDRWALTSESIYKFHKLNKENMKTILYIKRILTIGLICAICSCTPSDFDDLNLDKKTPSEPITSYMLTNALRYIPNAMLVSNEPQANFWMQYWTQIQYVAHEQYNFTENSFPYYQTTLINLNYIIEQNTNESSRAAVSVFGDNDNQLAIARILKAYYFLRMTDNWGDIPYFEALKGELGGDFLRPKVDSQKDIYYDLLKELTEAVDQANENSLNPMKGDFLFNGDMRKWKKFANTTRLIMAMRISDVDPEKGNEEFVNAINASGGIVESNSENLIYSFLDDELAENYNYFYNWNSSSSYSYAVAKPFVDNLLENNDPRLSIFADRAAANNEFVGQAVATVGEQSQFSQLGVNMRQKNGHMFIYSYAQVMLTLSEAAHRGWIPGGINMAKKYYNDAIKASFEQYGVFDINIYTQYIHSGNIEFSAARVQEQIGYEKWVALYPYGHESWAEWRRIGFPNLTPAAGAVTEDGEIPKRFKYHVGMKNLMPEEFAKVEARQSDKPTTRVWWDAK